MAHSEFILSVQAFHASQLSHITLILYCLLITGHDLLFESLEVAVDKLYVFLSREDIRL